MVEAKIIGKNIINGHKSEVKTLYKNKNQEIKVKNNNIEIDVSFAPLPANSIKINFFEYANKINEMILINKKENIISSYYLSEDHIEINSDKEEFDLKAGPWQIILEGNFENRIVKDFILLPATNKELNLNLIRKDEKVILEDRSFVLPEKPNNIRLDNNEIIKWDRTQKSDKYAIYKSKERSLGFPIKLVEHNSISLEKLEEGHYYWIRSYGEDGNPGEISKPYFIERGYNKYCNDYFQFEFPENWYIINDKQIGEEQANAIEVIIADEMPEKEIKRNIEHWEEPTQFIYKLFNLTAEDEMETENHFFDYVYDELNWFKNIAGIDVIESEKVVVDSQPGYRINIRYIDGYNMGDIIAENIFIYKDKKAHLIYYGALEDKFSQHIKKTLYDSLKYKK